MGWNQKNFLFEDPLEPYPALTTPVPANISPNKLAPNLPNNILRNPSFCSLASS